MNYIWCYHFTLLMDVVYYFWLGQNGVGFLLHNKVINPEGFHTLVFIFKIFFHVFEFMLSWPTTKSSVGPLSPFLVNMKP